MASIPSKHEYDPDDTQPVEYTPAEVELPPNVEKFLLKLNFERDSRQWAAFIAGDVELTSVEACALYDRVHGTAGGCAPLAFEPDPAMARQRTNWLSEGARSLARWLTTWADERERGA